MLRRDAAVGDCYRKNNKFCASVPPKSWVLVSLTRHLRSIQTIRLSPRPQRPWEQAFDMALAEILASRDPESLNEIVAKWIVQLARLGERDPQSCAITGWRIINVKPPEDRVSFFLGKYPPEHLLGMRPGLVV